MHKTLSATCKCGHIHIVEKDLSIPLETFACAVCGSENYISNYTKIDIALSEYCNLKCQMCRRPSYAVFMDKEWCKDVLSEAASIGVKVISFSGGEPFVHKGVWEILEHAFSLKLRVQMVTNGTLLKPEHVPILEKLDCCTVSLDGMRDAHDKIRGKVGSWDRTMRTIEMFAQSNIQWGTNTVMQKDNYTDILELFRHIQSIGGMKYSYCGFSNVEVVPETAHFQLSREEEESCYQQLLEIKELCKNTYTYFNDAVMLTEYFEKFSNKSMRVRPYDGCTLPTKFIGFSSHGFYLCWHIGKVLKQKSLIAALQSDLAKQIVQEGISKQCIGCNTFNYSWDKEWVEGILKSMDTNENVSHGVIPLPNPYDNIATGPTLGNTIEMNW